MKRFALLPFFLLLVSTKAVATTWDEPWQETVVKKSESFVKARALRHTDTSVTCIVERRLAGRDVPDTAVISGFYELHLGSMSEPLEFGFKDSTEYYLFLSRSARDKTFEIATPTSSWARIANGMVYATYRHSYHQALVREDLYVPTMSAIFHYIHNEPYDSLNISNFIRNTLDLTPYDIPTEKDRATNHFYEQHVALECFYYFGTPQEFKLLAPFLAYPSFHVKISAVRALSRLNTLPAKQALIDFLQNDSNHFAQVMAVWGLKRLNAREFLPELQRLVKDASTVETGFGGNLMDPRVGTSFPSSVKNAIETLIAEWS